MTPRPGDEAVAPSGQVEPWYATWFDGDAYALVYSDRDEAEAERVAAFIERVAAPPPGAFFVDVACGRGRHALAFARRGHRVVGVDLAARALDDARRAARAEGLDATFVRGDMREPYCDGCADGVVNLFTAFGYFEHEADNARAVAAMAHAVRPDGFLVQDFLNADRVRATLAPESARVVGAGTVAERRWIEGGPAPRVRKTITLHAGGREETHEESVRLYTPAELAGLHSAAGLRVEATYGDYDGAPLTLSSPRCIILSRRDG